MTREKLSNIAGLYRQIAAQLVDAGDEHTTPEQAFFFEDLRGQALQHAADFTVMYCNAKENGQKPAADSKKPKSGIPALW